MATSAFWGGGTKAAAGSTGGGSYYSPQLNKTYYSNYPQQTGTVGNMWDASSIPQDSTFRSMLRGTGSTVQSVADIATPSFANGGANGGWGNSGSYQFKAPSIQDPSAQQYSRDWADFFGGETRRAMSDATRRMATAGSRARGTGVVGGVAPEAQMYNAFMQEMASKMPALLQQGYTDLGNQNKTNYDMWLGEQNQAAAKQAAYMQFIQGMANTQLQGTTSAASLSEQQRQYNANQAYQQQQQDELKERIRQQQYKDAETQRNFEKQQAQAALQMQQMTMQNAQNASQLTSLANVDRSKILPSVYVQAANEVLKKLPAGIQSIGGTKNSMYYS